MHLECANLAVGDFNGDGKLDFALAAGPHNGNPPGHIEVRLSIGDRTFRTSWRYGSYFDNPNLAVGDFDGDGKLDLAAIADGELSIFLGNGDGTFHRGATYRIRGYGPIIADFNGDGKLDLVIDSAAGIVLLLGNGNGTFQSPRTVFPKHAP